VIGHALAFAPRADTQRAWDRAIALGFGIGSLCFVIGPFPGIVQLVGAEADAAIFFAGSIFFTLAAGLELREGTARRGRRWGRDPSWWSAFVQFLGTLLFNLSTYDALDESLSAHQENRLIWAPDVFGSICFLVSGVLAYRVAVVAAAGRRGRDWTMAAINLAGCVLFMISAIASYVVPDSGTVLDLAAANWCTSLGAMCFFAGAVGLFSAAGAQDRTEPAPTPSPPGPTPAGADGPPTPRR
jgi:hypothetical protein